MTIIVTYSAIDGYRDRRTFKTLAGARAFAVRGVGNNPDMGHGYAVSYDGIGRVTVTGVTLAELFGISEPAEGPFVVQGACVDEDAGTSRYYTVHRAETLTGALHFLNAIENERFFHEGGFIIGATAEAQAEINDYYLAEQDQYLDERARRFAGFEPDMF